MPTSSTSRASTCGFEQLRGRRPPRPVRDAHLRRRSEHACSAAGESVDSGLEAEALLLLGEVYLKMHKFQDARESFTVLLQDYPRSPLVVQATNYLAYMKERGV